MTGQNWPDGVAAKGRAKWGQFVFKVPFQFHTINGIFKILKQFMSKLICNSIALKAQNLSIANFVRRRRIGSQKS